MRALTMILLAATLGLWGYYAALVMPANSALPVAVRPDNEELSAASLNNEGVRLARTGRQADALAYLQRAHDFRPRDLVIARNVERQEARLRKAAWARVLLVASAAAVLLVLWHGVRGVRDRGRLKRMRLRGERWFLIPRDTEHADLSMRFSEPLDGLVRRHPLTIVWSSARHGKHMKSRPPVEARGRELTVKLERERLERLRRYPGEWRGFLYFGRTQVGEAAARVI